MSFRMAYRKPHAPRSVRRVRSYRRVLMDSTSRAGRSATFVYAALLLCSNLLARRVCRADRTIRRAVGITLRRTRGIAATILNAQEVAVWWAVHIAARWTVRVFTAAAAAKRLFGMGGVSSGPVCPTDDCQRQCRHQAQENLASVHQRHLLKETHGHEAGPPCFILLHASHLP